MANALYYGDNLEVLRREIGDGSVDLVYLDPPFNSQANYNVLFKSPAGKAADAQIEAFEDTWHWGEEAERAFAEVLASPATQAAELLRAMRSFLGENDMMAYLAMMAVRLIELHRVLKPTGSLYLHCDPTASHYLKILLDGIFGAFNIHNEIIWRRARAHNDKTIRRYGAVHDTILFYAKSSQWVFNVQFLSRNASSPKTHDLYLHRDGKFYRKDNCRAPGGRGPLYEWNGHTFNWRFSPDERDRLIAQGRIVYSKNGMPRVLRPIDPERGSPLQDVWTDIDAPNSGSVENLGYPTQKPLALLERIIRASSNEGDLVLDPFCGCGTTIHAAQKLGRAWIGIDVTHLAISLIERRLKDAFPGVAFDVHGTPKDLESAVDLARRDKYQFQWWAVSLVDARPYGGKKKGADGGIDGILFFRSDKDKTEKALISVKGGDNVGVGMVRDLIAVVEREKAAVGVLISLALPTRAMEREAIAAGFFEGPFEAVPKIQIITLAELFQGIRPRIPRIDAAATFRTAAREPTADQGRLL